MRWMYLTLIVVAVCGTSALLRGDEAPATQPSAEPTTKPSAGRGRLFGPYAKLTDLTDDQKDKIREIHRKALDAMHDILAKEMDDINAVLTDDQKQEMHQIEDKAAADRKAKSGHKKSDSTSDSNTQQ